MSDIYKKMGQRAFGGAAQPGKRTCSPTDESSPKRPAATAPANGLFQGQRTPPPREPRIPALFLDTPDDWPTHAAKMKELVDDDFDAVYRGSRFRITTSTVSHFRKLQRYLYKEKLSFHTFSLGRHRPLKVVISGLPGDTDNLKLSDALVDEGFEVTDVARLKTSRGPTKSWLVTLTPDGEREDPQSKKTADIWKLTVLFHVRIHVSIYKRPAGPPQCHRCQDFGHGSANCGRPVRCVRCAGAHLRDQCPKPKEEAGVCCNCGGQHNANYRGCKAYKEAKKRPGTTIKRRDAKAGKTALGTSTAPPPKRKAQEEPTPTQPVEDKSASDPEGFEVVKRRRKRLPRNPDNRQPREVPAPPAKEKDEGSSQPASAEPARPEPTPRRRVVKAAEGDETAARESTPAAARLPTAKANDVASALLDITRQLTALCSALADLLPALRQD